MGSLADRPTNAEYRVLVQHSPMLMWRTGIDGGANYVNDAWLGFTGRPLADELGDGWLASVHQDDLARVTSTWRTHLEQHSAFELELRLRRHDGAYRRLFATNAPYVDERGQFAGFIGNGLDIDDRHQEDAARRTFLAMLAHELRAPLAPLRSLPMVLERRIANGEPIGKDITGLLRRQVQRFATLIDQFTEITNDGQHLPLEERVVFDLAELTRELVQDRQTTLELSLGRPMTLELHIADGRYPVLADRQRIGQTLLTLLDNALKYTPAGGTVSVTLETEGDRRFALRVRDNGIGIPEQELTRIGERYYRASNATANHYPGLGLGLSIASQTLERHDGELRIESQLARGTTASALLPRAAHSGGAHERGSRARAG